VLLVVSCCRSLCRGVWLIYLLGYPVSVAVIVGFIALAGVATEFGVVMLLYLDKMVESFRADGRLTKPRKCSGRPIIQGAVLNCSKLMTGPSSSPGLLPGDVRAVQSEPINEANRRALDRRDGDSGRCCH